MYYSVESLKSLEDLQDEYSEHSFTALETKYEDLNKLICGFVETNLIICAARPSMGKTSLALDVSLDLAQRGSLVHFYSIESSRFEILERAMANLDSDNFGNISLYVCDSSYITPQDVIERSEDAGPELVVIDYLQLMQPDEGAGGNNNVDVGNISKALKRIAKTIPCTVLALSQLNRGLEIREDKRPKLSDLRDSGQIEQDADIVLGLYRPDVYRQFKRDDGATELLLLKNRNGPANKTVFLTFEQERYRFY